MINNEKSSPMMIVPTNEKIKMKSSHTENTRNVYGAHDKNPSVAIRVRAGFKPAPTMVRTITMMAFTNEKIKMKSSHTENTRNVYGAHDKNRTGPTMMIILHIITQPGKI